MFCYVELHSSRKIDRSFTKCLTLILQEGEKKFICIFIIKKKGVLTFQTHRGLQLIWLFLFAD